MGETNLRLVLAMTFLTAFLGTLAFRISIPAVAFYTRSVLKGTMLELGLLTTSFFVTRAISAVITGDLADRGLNLRVLASSCFLIHSGIVLLYQLTSSWLQVVALRALQGLLNGFSWVSVQFLLGASVKREIRGRAYSIYFAFGSLGAFSGNLIYSLMTGAPLLKLMALSSLFFLSTALTAFLIKGSEVGGPRKQDGKAASKANLGRWADGLLPWISIMVFSSRSFSSLLTGDVIYIYLSEGLGLGPSLASFLVGSGSLIGLAASLPVSWIADKKDDRLALQIAVGAVAIGAFAFSLKSPTASVAGYLMLVMGVVSLTPVVRRLTMTYQRRRGVALGAVNAVGNVGTATSSLLLGGLLEAMGMSTLTIAGLELMKAVFLTSIALVLAILASVVKVRRALGKLA